MDRVSSTVELVKRLLSVDRSAAEPLLAAHRLNAIAVLLFAAEQFAFSVWSPSGTFIAVKAASILVGLKLIQMVLRRMSAPLPYGVLFRAAAFLGVVDMLGVLGSVGTILAVMAWAWCLLAFSAVVEELTGLGGRHVVRITVAGIGAGALVALGLVSGAHEAARYLDGWQPFPVEEELAPTVEPAPAKPAVVVTPAAPTPPPPDEEPAFTAAQRRVVENLMGTWVVDERSTLEANPDPSLHRALKTQVLPMMRDLRATWREDGTSDTTVGNTSLKGRWKVLSVDGTRVSLEVTQESGERAITVVDLPIANTLLVVQEAGTIVFTRPPTVAFSSRETLRAEVFAPRGTPRSPGVSSVVENHANGMPRLRATRVNGHYEGAYTEYHSNGVIRLSGYYITGRREGVWTDFDMQGTQLGETIYRNGASIGSTMNLERFKAQLRRP